MSDESSAGVEEQEKINNEEEQKVENTEDNVDDVDDEEKSPDAPLTEEIMAGSLLLLCKTGNGLSHAYVRLDAAQKELTDISIIKNYIHLRYIDISNNNLKDISALNNLTHLLTLKADFNKLTQIKLEPLPYLQHASFTNNRIRSTEGISHPKLEHLNLNKNEIAEVNGLESEKLPSLLTLELRENKLQTTKGIKVASLKSLFLAANQITTLEDLGELKNLAALHLRDNKLDKLDGFMEKMNSLQYINIRGNLISDYAEVKKLQCLPKLRAIVLLDTPLTENGDYRLEVLISVRRLERLDKDEYLQEERTEAEEIYEQRRLKEEEDVATALLGGGEGDNSKVEETDDKGDTDD